MSAGLDAHRYEPPIQPTCLPRPPAVHIETIAAPLDGRYVAPDDNDRPSIGLAAGAHAQATQRVEQQLEMAERHERRPPFVGGRAISGVDQAIRHAEAVENSAPVGRLDMTARTDIAQSVAVNANRFRFGDDALERGQSIGKPGGRDTQSGRRRRVE